MTKKGLSKVFMKAAIHLDKNAREHCFHGTCSAISDTIRPYDYDYSKYIRSIYKEMFEPDGMDPSQYWWDFNKNDTEARKLALLFMNEIVNDELEAYFKGKYRKQYTVKKILEDYSYEA